MNLFFDKLEAALKQFLRVDESGSSTPTVDVQVRASVLMAFTRGRLQRFARSGFKRLPSEQLAACLAQVL
jgi:TetR/AcrR family transcriptional regulator